MVERYSLYENYKYPKMKEKYKYTSSHKKPGHGKNYDAELYTKDSYFYRVWQIEKYILKRELLSQKNINLLDFACGTGRVTQYLEELHFKNITGIDVSSAMLKEAKHKLIITKIINMDITSNIKAKNKLKSFDTITAFRFFLNADEGLRKKVLLSLKSLLKYHGKLIFNIHGNKFSYRFFTLFISSTLDLLQNIIRGRNSKKIHYRKLLSIFDIKKLLSESGFRIVSIYSYSFIPASLTSIIPKKLWMMIEKTLINREMLFGSHLMIVANKTNNKNE